MSMVNELVAGDSLNFNTTVPDFSAAEGWVLFHRLLPRTGGAEIVLSSLADEAKHRTQKVAADTVAWVPGVYDWVSYVIKGAERYTVSSGELVIRPDSAVAPALNVDSSLSPAAASLTQAQHMVAKYVEAETAAMAGIEVRLGVSGGGIDRSWRSADLQQLRAGRLEWERRVADLQRAAAGVQGFGGVSYSLAAFDQ